MSSGAPGDRSAQRTQPWPAPAPETAEEAEAPEAVATTGPPSRAVTAVTRTRRLPSPIVKPPSPEAHPEAPPVSPQRARRGEVNAQCLAARGALAAGQADDGGLGGLVGGALRAHHGERRGQVRGVRAGDDDLPERRLRHRHPGGGTAERDHPPGML